MSWLTVQFELEADAAAMLSDALIERGALAVTLEDAASATAPETRRGRDARKAGPFPWCRNRVSVLLDRGADAAAVLAAAASAAGLAQPRRFKVDRVRDGDWVRRSQSQFGPIAIGGRLRIVPSWRKPPRRPGAVVRMDPGLAFGTGSHPTTRLALAWLEQAIRGGERLLDYGCGSGILAIAARKLGAAGADAVDTDPEARAVADRNARRNKAAVRVFAPEALPPGSYDVLVANILANPLLELAPAFAARVHRAGQLALSGILASQAQPLVEAYAPAFRLEAVRKEKGWVLLAGARQ